MSDKAHKTVSIFVNQDEHEVGEGKISYDQVVAFYIKGRRRALERISH